LVHLNNIGLKKQHGQNFLRNQRIIDRMIAAVNLSDRSSVLEIGCGDGFLTKTILAQPIARLWTFEIDPEWAEFVKKNLHDPRLHVYQEDFLRTDMDKFEEHRPWIITANLPYHLTFPILKLVLAHRTLFQEGVIMVQEEVAQKITGSRGRCYGFISLYFQYFFTWQLLDKVAPTCFVPSPKVFSRVLHFTPKKNLTAIVDIENFWIFIKRCFAQPRRTLKNNLSSYQYPVVHFDQGVLAMRAQQLSFEQLLTLWNIVCTAQSHP
jgi:16S rRNA (adenine1518-N6/adenine1519-N6)-dimethyltransferase